MCRNIKYKKIKVSDKSSKPNKNWELPNALVKEMFGDFQIKERDGTWIITEPKWREENIETIKKRLTGWQLKSFEEKNNLQFIYTSISQFLHQNSRCRIQRDGWCENGANGK